MSNSRILLALVVALAAPQALAQQAPKSPVTGASQQARPVADAAAEAFNALDKDRNGTLSLVEFRAGWQQRQRAADTQARLRQQFSTVDANKNGAIDPGEYGSLLLVKQAGKSAPQMSVFDANKDGKLAFGEYAKLVQTLAPKEAAKDVVK